MAPKQFYTEQLSLLEGELRDYRQRLFVSSMLRLALFLAAATVVYFLWGDSRIVITTILVTIVAFIFLVNRHSKLQYQRDLRGALIKMNTTELAVLERRFQDLPDGLQFLKEGHAYAQDIDLFGRGSFYQYLNRTALESGAVKLAHWLLSNNINHIPERQESVRELSRKPKWRQNFSAIATLVKTEIPVHALNGWLKNYKPYVPQLMRWLPQAFSIGSIVIWAIYIFGVASGYLVFGWFLLGLGIAGAYMKKTMLLSTQAGKAQGTLEQYHKLLQEIESTEFESELLKVQRNRVVLTEHSASGILKQFSKALDALDQRNNMLFGALANGFMLWDLWQGYKIEKWIGAHSAHVSQWFNTIAYFDATNTLANFAFNHPDYVYPKIVDADEQQMAFTGLTHPLLDPSKSVANNFSIKSEEFFIITGANMAGKSTFLRTVSLSMVMTHVGLPVCAGTARYSPIPLITSMRTTDSLSDEASYFYAELKRLQDIVLKLEGNRYFIVLDEILKGTNSTDKAIGSRKFVEKLLRSKSTGLIATHDLSLCTLGDAHEAVTNYYFDAEIKKDELYFDYTLKPGVCQNMNASFLLKKMGIVD